MLKNLTLFISTIVLIPAFSVSAEPKEDAIVLKEFVFEQAPFPSCHASTVVEVEPDHLLSAWFGGTDEGEPDVGIWCAHRKTGEWTPPVEVAQHSGVPCWNPVLFKDKKSGQILLFYKAGPNPEQWTGFLKRSMDGGETWSESEKLPAGILGPIRSKPYQLDDGTLICGSSVESWQAWGCWCEITKDLGRTWFKGSPINLPDEYFGLIQPSPFRAGPNKLRMVMRSRRKIGRIAMTESTDNGVTWTPAVLTDLPNPNAGCDAVNLSDGRVALIYNHSDHSRETLNLAISNDGGDAWKKVLDLEYDPGREFSYPALIQTSDGMLATTYTWHRKRIRFVVIDPKKLD